MPPDFAAEMVPFDPLVGEFRVHYAGFFDPGFGHSPDGLEAARAVLEVRSREVPFIIEDGQIVGRLVYERMVERPHIALRRRPRLELPGPGAEAVQALPVGDAYRSIQALVLAEANTASRMRMFVMASSIP